MSATVCHGLGRSGDLDGGGFGPGRLQLGRRRDGGGRQRDHFQRGGVHAVLRRLGDFVHQFFQRIFDPIYDSRLQRCGRCPAGAWDLWRFGL